MATNVLAKMAVLIEAQTAQFNKSLAQSESRLQKFAKTSQTSGTAISSSLGLTAIGATAIAGAVGNAINIVKNFEQQMATVKAITGASADEFNRLRTDAIKLAQATKFTATEVAGLQIEYGRLGFTTDEIINATEATIALSIATGEDLSKSADVLGSTLRSFNIDSDETGRLADVMAGAFNRSALGLENYSEAIKYVAPIAAANNISLEETTALLGILADNGIRGSMAGTSLRKIFSDLKGETGTFAERLQKLADKGISSADAMDEVGRTAYASLLILAKNTTKSDALTDALINIGNEAQETADIVGDTLAGDLDKLKSAYESLILSGGPFGDMLREVAQAATNLINAFNSSATSGVISFLKTLVSYTPNIYTLSKAINALTDSLELTKKEAIEYIKVANEFREAAIREGDQEAVKKYTGIIAELTAKYGLLTDKAVEFKDEVKEDPVVIDASVKSISELKRELENLTKKYTTLAGSKNLKSSDIDKLKSIDEEISATKSLIDILEKYGKTQNGLIPSIEKDIKSLQTAISKSFDESEISDFTRQIEVLQDRIKQINSLGDIDFSPFRLDSIAEAYKKVKDEFKKQADDLTPFLESLNPVVKIGEKIEINKDLRNQINSLVADVKKAANEMIQLGPLLANSIAGVADALGSAFGSNDFSNFGDAVLKAVADFAKQLGSLMISIGVGEIALQSGNPYVMIAAGAALVAVGAALSAHLDKQKNLVTGATGGGSSSNNAGSFDTSDVSSKIILGGEFKISGRDLALVLDQQNIRSQRTG
jgi:hypothetical protein